MNNYVYVISIIIFVLSININIINAQDFNVAASPPAPPAPPSPQEEGIIEIIIFEKIMLKIINISKYHLILLLK